MNKNYDIINIEGKQFQVTLQNAVARLEYQWQGECLALMHTEVPEEYEGQGIASALAKFALEYAKANGLKVMAYCPYVDLYVRRHPEYNQVVVPIEHH